MKRWIPIGIQFLAVASLALGASAAHAASVRLEMDRSGFGVLYAPGETITLTVFVTANAGEVDTSAFGVVLYDSAYVTPLAGTNIQNPLPATANGPWNQGVLPACTSVACRAFSQTNPGGSVGVTDFVIATLKFTKTALTDPPIYGFRWLTTPASQRLDFFGVTNAPGVFTIAPEPATGALLALGLLGLGVAGRRRG